MSSPLTKIILRRASAALEFVTLILFILGVFLVFRHYIIRGLAGKWKAATDTIGLGRQYDPRPFGSEGKEGGTLRCYWENRPGVSGWVDRQKAEELGCDCTLLPTDPLYPARCTNCLLSAKNPACEAGMTF